MFSLIISSLYGTFKAAVNRNEFRPSTHNYRVPSWPTHPMFCKLVTGIQRFRSDFWTRKLVYVQIEFNSCTKNGCSPKNTTNLRRDQARCYKDTTRSLVCLEENRGLPLSETKKIYSDRTPIDVHRNRSASKRNRGQTLNINRPKQGHS